MPHESAQGARAIQVNGASATDGVAPPHDLNAEAAVLSAVLVDPAALAKVLPLLDPTHFYSEAHRRVYEAACDVSASGAPVDVTTVAARLKSTGRLAQVGGAGYLTTLLNAAPFVRNVAGYASIVLEQAQRRDLIVTCQRTASLAYVTGAQTSELLAAHRAEVDGLAAPLDAHAWSARIAPVDREWLSTPPPKREWLLRDSRTAAADGVFPLGKVGQLFAAGGVGKTMALMQAGIAVTTGTPLLGTFTTRGPGRALVVLGEEDRDEVRRRTYHAARAAQTRAPDPDALVTLPLAGMPCAMLERDASGNLVETRFYHWLLDYLARSAWSLIVIDPLSRFAGADAETDNAAATRFIQSLEGIASVSGASVLVAHHTSKLSRTAGAQVNAASGRGSSAFVDGARWVATLSSERVELAAPEDRERLGDVVTFAVAKSNYSMLGEPLRLRRSREHGGALLPLDSADDEILAAARREADPRRRIDAARDVRAQERATDDARALVQVLAAHPGGIGVRALRAEVRAMHGRCDDRRVDAALARLGGAVLRSPGAHNAVLHTLNPSALPDDLRPITEGRS